MSLKQLKKYPKKFRICLLGPKYVGKTQIVNRFINNSFSGYYEPTTERQVYKRAYNLNDDEPDQDPVFFEIEIVDLFPHDHPFMDEEVELMNYDAREMEAELNKVIANKDTEHGVIDQIHAYMFVFDSSNKRTFESMNCMLSTICELEKTRKKGAQSSGGKKKGKELRDYYPKKIVVGNKKDLKKNRDAGVFTSQDLEQLEGIKIKEVSALTNQGIQEIFKMLINEMNTDQAMTKIQQTYAADQLAKIKGAEVDQDEDDLKNDKKDKKDDKKNIQKQSKNKDDGGGFFSCCGPRQAEVIESDEEDNQNQDSDDEDEVVEKKDQDDEKEEDFVAEECYSHKQLLEMGLLQGNMSGNDPQNTPHGEKEKCLIF